jgi:hypothetical protein
MLILDCRDNSYKFWAPPGWRFSTVKRAAELRQETKKYVHSFNDWWFEAIQVILNDCNKNRFCLTCGYSNKLTQVGSKGRHQETDEAPVGAAQHLTWKRPWSSHPTLGCQRTQYKPDTLGQCELAILKACKCWSCFISFHATQQIMTFFPVQQCTVNIKFKGKFDNILHISSIKVTLISTLKTI